MGTFLSLEFAAKANGRALATLTKPVSNAWSSDDLDMDTRTPMPGESFEINGDVFPGNSPYHSVKEEHGRGLRKYIGTLLI